MTRERRKADRPEGYEDFLGEISHESAMKDQEMDFMESIGPEASTGDEELVNVGERVRVVRERRGLSLQDIARRTGIQEQTLASIEDGRIAPPLGTIIKLAKALEMKMGYFISGEENRPYTIVRRDDRRVVSRHDSKKGEQYGYEFESLAPHKRDRHMEPFLVTLDPAETEEERSTHDGQEFIFVLQGRMEVRLGEEIHILDAGDAIYYDSTVPHLVKCYGKESTRILAVLYAEK
ncbi:MAG: XRE family transcriptional regulator [Deltaproteobacteria bacterium]|nr:XRE family transcriptional regulator [Deltaproteobacteria bacterium]